VIASGVPASSLDAPAGASAPARRAWMARHAAESVKERPAEAVHRVEVDARALPARLGHLAGREGWWFAWRFQFGGLAPEERVAHLLLWHDGRGWQALDAAAASLFASLPARPGGGTMGGAGPLGATSEEAVSRLHEEARAEIERRSMAAFDAARERLDRATEDALAADRKNTESAREAWKRAREALLVDGGSTPSRDRRALLERAEREYRLRLDDLRTAETTRLGEKDRAIAELRRRAEVRGQRKLVATAWWRCA
jgi:hypothetical protein